MVKKRVSGMSSQFVYLRHPLRQGILEEEEQFGGGENQEFTFWYVESETPLRTILEEMSFRHLCLSDLGEQLENFNMSYGT